jgi:type 1 glutamine amidotransferase
MESYSTGLLVFDGLFHPPWLGRRNLERSLRMIPGWAFKRVPSLEKTLQLAMDSFPCLALYFHHKTLSQPALDRLDQYLRQGGGVLAIHSASASFKEQSQYFQILGGRFREHEPVEKFWVNPSDEKDDIFSGIPGFALQDELYRHEYDPTNQVHFTTTVDGEIEPVVWTRHHGKGRVCYCSLGHTISSMRNPHVLKILRRGLLWCAGEPMETI